MEAASENPDREAAIANLDRLRQLGSTNNLKQNPGESFNDYRARCVPIYEEITKLTEEFLAYLRQNPVILYDGKRVEIHVHEGKGIPMSETSAIQGDGCDGFACNIKVGGETIQAANFKFLSPKFDLP